MKPTKEKVRISVSAALMEYFPSKSVVVPVFVPLITTLTPGKGTPDSSDIIPEIFC